MQQLIIREPKISDESVFVVAMQNSQTLHRPWVKSPQTKAEFTQYYQRAQLDNQKSFLVCEREKIVGVYNISEIVRGVFQSAYLGFYVVANYAGQGYMSRALKLILPKIFDELKLHRIEANIQPKNSHSINLVKANGFRLEGLSPRYLNINGVWCDHERWALTHEDWLDLK